MDRRSFPFLMAAAVLLPSLILACCTGAGRKSLPCDIYRNNTETVLDFTVLPGDIESSDEPSVEPSDEPSESSEPSEQPSAEISGQSETSADTTESSITPGADTVKTGDTSYTVIILAVLTVSLASALVLVKRRKRNPD